MRVTVDTPKLITAVNHAASVVGPSPLISFAHLTLDADGDLFVTGRGKGCTITRQMRAAVSNPGRCMVRSEHFAEWVRRIDKRVETVSLELVFNDRLLGVAGDSRINLPVLDAPELHSVANRKSFNGVPVDLTLQRLELASSFAAKKHNKLAFEGVYVGPQGIAATDHAVLCMFDGGGCDVPAIIPAQVAKIAVPFADDGQILVSKDGDEWRIESALGHAFGPCVADIFPDSWTRFRDADTTALGTFFAPHLFYALDLMNPTKSEACFMKGGLSGCVISAESDKSRAETPFDAVVSTPFAVELSLKRLRTICLAHGDREVRMSTNGAMVKFVSDRAIAMLMPRDSVENVLPRPQVAA